MFSLGSFGLILAMTLNRHKHPLNPYLLFVFILLEAVIVAFIVIFSDVHIVLQDFILTHAVFPDSTVCVLRAQLCPALCNPRDCSLPGSSVHGLLQARILEWFAISFSRGPS